MTMNTTNLRNSTLLVLGDETMPLRVKADLTPDLEGETNEDLRREIKYFEISKGEGSPDVVKAYYYVWGNRYIKEAYQDCRLRVLVVTHGQGTKDVADRLEKRWRQKARTIQKAMPEKFSTMDQLLNVIRETELAKPEVIDRVRRFCVVNEDDGKNLTLLENEIAKGFHELLIDNVTASTETRLFSGAVMVNNMCRTLLLLNPDTVLESLE